jgi:hypothetical protein
MLGVMLCRVGVNPNFPVESIRFAGVRVISKGLGAITASVILTVFLGAVSSSLDRFCPARELGDNRATSWLRPTGCGARIAADTSGAGGASAIVLIFRSSLSNLRCSVALALLMSLTWAMCSSNSVCAASRETTKPEQNANRSDSVNHESPFRTTYGSSRPCRLGKWPRLFPSPLSRL